jgi:hypothetical protein
MSLTFGTAMGVLCVSLILCSSGFFSGSLATVASSGSVSAPTAPEMGDTGGDPPIVTILNENFTDVEAVSISVDEPLTLIGYAVGQVPLFYYWFEGDLIGTGNVLCYIFPEVGEFVVTLEVVDANGLSGFDSVVVTVEGGSSGPSVDEMIDDLIGLIEDNGGFAEPQLRNLLVNRLNGLVDQLNGWIAELEALGDRCPRLAERIQRLIDRLNDRIDKLNARIDALNALPTKQDAMINKLLEVKDLPTAEAYQKVLRDIKPKLTGLKEDEAGNPWGNGIYRNPWVVDADCRALYLAPVNEILCALAAQL